MRLNKNMRQTIIDNIMRDFKTINYSAEIEQYVKKWWEVTMPKEVFALYKDNILRLHLNTRSVYVDHSRVAYLNGWPEHDTLPDNVCIKVREFWKLKSGQKSRFDDATYALHCMLNAYTEANTFFKDHPEFAEYIPSGYLQKKSKTEVLVVTNVLDGLKALGWGKTDKA